MIIDLSKPNITPIHRIGDDITSPAHFCIYLKGVLDQAPYGVGLSHERVQYLKSVLNKVKLPPDLS